MKINNKLIALALMSVIATTSVFASQTKDVNCKQISTKAGMILAKINAEDNYAKIQMDSIKLVSTKKQTDSTLYTYKLAVSNRDIEEEAASYYLITSELFSGIVCIVNKVEFLNESEI